MSKSTPRKALIIGARSVRQGTGPFIASGLARAGAHIAGIVGTSERSVSEALDGLQATWGIATQGFTDMSTALETVRPDIVALCSPWRFHGDQLLQVAQAGCHCLVEKPMAWPASEAQASEIVSAFEQQGLLLQVVSQWPTTLATFESLHGKLPAPIQNFSMRLSPISIGMDMLTDSAPHFISMLQALAGSGDCSNCVIATDESREKLTLDCHYEHPQGVIKARLILETCAQRPRPAWYEINGLRAEREVSLPDYQQSLAGAGRRVDFKDPIYQVTANFLADLANGVITNGNSLRSAHGNLLQLARAWR